MDSDNDAKKCLWVEHILLKERKKLLGNGDGSLIFGRSQKKSGMEKHHSQHGVIMMIQTSIPGLSTTLFYGHILTHLFKFSLIDPTLF